MVMVMVMMMMMMVMVIVMLMVMMTVMVVWQIRVYSKVIMTPMRHAKVLSEVRLTDQTEMMEQTEADRGSKRQ
jgi:hypothetical protein